MFDVGRPEDAVAVGVGGILARQDLEIADPLEESDPKQSRGVARANQVAAVGGGVGKAKVLVGSRAAGDRVRVATLR